MKRSLLNFDFQNQFHSAFSGQNFSGPFVEFTTSPYGPEQGIYRPWRPEDFYYECPYCGIGRGNRLGPCEQCGAPWRER